MKAILIVLDSVGIGAAPDAADYGDTGANTLANTAKAVGGIRAPMLQKMGLGNIPGILHSKPIAGIPPVGSPVSDFGAMRELSKGKDTTTGHWEMAGLELKKGFHIFPSDYPSFPAQLTKSFEALTGRKILGNKAASGTVIIEELGAEQMKTGAWIVYTSVDSVFQIAAHEDVIPLNELYRGCKTARALCDELRVGRVIARPYTGRPGSFHRTSNRRDYSFPLPEPTVLDRLADSAISVHAVGKIEDIFNHSGITRSFHTANNEESQRAVKKLIRENAQGLIFANLIDFDMLFGHRRDPSGYAKAIEKTDVFLGEILPMISSDDILLITADHGTDPTFKGTDHTREYVPILAYRKGKRGKNIGIRQGFFDVAQSLASFFGIPPMPRGASFVD